MLRSLALVSTLALSVAGSPACAQPTPRAQVVARIDSIARRAIGPMLAGLTIAVVHRGDTLALAPYGRADLEWDVPMTADAVFEIGSITKQFTAAAVLQLVGEGKIRLDDDVTAYLPDYPTQGRRLTIRRLLDHTSGIRSYTEMPEFRSIAAQPLGRDTLVKLFSRAPFDFDPGAALVYNNSAYFLLGEIVAKVGGPTYATYVQQKLFAPLGMSRSSYCTDRGLTARRAHGYDAAAGTLVRAANISHVWPYAAGSLCSTAGDLLAWLGALHGGRVLSPALYRELITPDTLVDGTRVRYAKGLMLGSTAGHRHVGHGGDIPGYSTEARWYPDDGLAVIVLANSLGPVRPATIADSIAVAVLGRQPAPAPVALPANVASIAGQWRGIGRGGATLVTFAVQGDTVTMQRAGGRPARLAYRGDWRFETPGGITFTFRAPARGAAPTAVVQDAFAGVMTLTRVPASAPR